MALPPPPPPVLGSLNPIEIFVNGFNTNPYFIGLMMLIMNFGGRHIAGSLTPEQDKIFQNPWIRRSLLFVVVFVATRNIFTAFWLSLGIVLLVHYLTNETSPLYLFGAPVKPVEAPPVQPAAGLTPDEQDIFRRLSEKVARSESENKKKAEGPADEAAFHEAYPMLMYQMTRA